MQDHYVGIDNVVKKYTYTESENNQVFFLRTFINFYVLFLQERKLHPSLSHSVGNLKKTLTDILQKMKRKLEEVNREEQK